MDSQDLDTDMDEVIGQALVIEDLSQQYASKVIELAQWRVQAQIESAQVEMLQARVEELETLVQHQEAQVNLGESRNPNASRGGGHQ